MSDAAEARRNYRNKPMERDTAVSIAADVGVLLDTKPVRVVANGDGFDLVIPAEAAPELAKALDAQSRARYCGK